MGTAYSFDLASKKIGTLDNVESAAHTSLITDTLYGVLDTEIRPLFLGAVTTGVWRSKVSVQDDHPGFGWLRVDGDFVGSVILRLYADQVLFYTVTLAADSPVRVPPGRSREWEVEVEGTGTPTAVVLATTKDELEMA